MSHVLEVTKEDFQKEVIECDLPVFVDFYTVECGPCQAFEPVLEDVAEELDGKIKFVKHLVTYEEFEAKSNPVQLKYDIISFPSLYLFNNGEVVKSFTGFLGREDFLDFLKEVL